MLQAFCICFAMLLNFLVTNSTQNLIALDETDTKNYTIFKCIIEISERELYWKPTIVLKVAREPTMSETIFTHDLIRKLNEEEVPYMTMDTINDGTLEATNASYLVIGYFEDCNALTKFNFFVIEDEVKYLIIIQNYSNNICKRNFKGVGNIIGSNDISFVVEHTKDVYKLYTYVPEIDSKTCQMIVGKPVKINTCQNGKLTENEVFPVKYPTNYNKCPIKVGMGSLYPFAMIEGKGNLKTNDRIDESMIQGMDLKLIKIILGYFNVTIDLYYIYKHEENAFVNKDFLQLVLNGSLEICAGGIYRIYGDVVEYSGVYVRQKITWMYYAERFIKTWQTFVPTVDGLYLFMVFYFSYSAVMYVISTFDEDVFSLIHVLVLTWGALVGSTSLVPARSFKQKILNAVYLIMCLHLAVYINIQLYSFFTIQEPPVVYKNNVDLMESGRVPYLQPLAKNFLNDEKYVKYANTSKDCKNFSDCAKVSQMKKAMTVVIEEFAINFQVETAVNNEARMLLAIENILTVYYEMIIRKGHPIAKKFRRMMERLIEAGVPEKLLIEAVGMTVVNKAGIATRTLLSKSYNCQYGCTLSIEQLGGVFYIVVFGCLVSSVIFVVELVGNRKDNI